MRGSPFLLALSAALVCGVAAAQEGDDLVRQGAEQEAAGRFDEAVAAYTSALERDPKNSAAYGRRGIALSRKGNCERAVGDLQVFASLVPDADRHGPVWDEAIEQLAKCRRGANAFLTLLPDREMLCRVDAGAKKAAFPQAPERLELASGDHTVECAVGDELFRQTIHLKPGEARELQIPAGQVPAAPEPAPGVAAPSLPTPRPPPPSFEGLIGGGVSPGAGAFGLSVGVRLYNFGLSMGSGYSLFAVQGTWFFLPGSSGPYLGVGYVRMAPNVFGSGSPEAGHEGYVVGGFDLRPVPHLSVRIGGGLAYVSVEHNSGPLVFDLCAFWVP